jgi:acetyltransferase
VVVNKTRIESVLRPTSIVLVGASERPGTLGDVVRRNLLAGGFTGAVHYVNPAHDTIGGQPVYRNVRELPEAVDLAIVVTPVSAVAEVISDCGERGVRGVVVVTSSFRDGGASSEAMESEFKRLARSYGMRLLGPGSLGVIRTESHLNATAGPGQPLPGRLALVSQSGALCSALLDWARSRQVGFSSVISTGAGVDIGFGEILDFLVRDHATDSIMLYMEGVDDARRFMSALRAAARVKPVVVMKAGRHVRQPDAAAFHSGSLVGADDVFDAAMRRAGVLRIRDFRDFFTAIATLGAGVRVNGRRLAIVANAGGPGTLAADRATGRWLQLAPLEPASLQKLKDVLPSTAAPENPVCMRGEVGAAQFAAAAAVCLEDPGVDVLLAILAPHPQADPSAFAAALIDAASRSRKPVFTCWMGAESVAASRALFAEHSLPNYTSPEAAVDAIAALSMHAANQEQLLQVPELLARTSAPDRVAAQAIIDAALASDREWLDPAQSKDVLAAFGIPVLLGRAAHTEDEAVAIAEQVGYPVAMKILSPDIPHKTDVGGVRLGVVDEAAVRKVHAVLLAAVTKRSPDARIEGVLIERMYRERNGRELMIGVVRDPVFGPAISFGLGGTLVEVIRDRAAALPPLNRYLARDLIRHTRASQALQPLRGAPAADEAAVEEILLRVSELICEMPDIGALDLNPVIATDQGAVVVDARIAVRRSPVARPYRHMAIHPYPSGLVKSIVLQGGVAATLRPIRPEDAVLEHAFVHGLSEQSRFLRFMFALHDLAPAMLSRFTQIDYDRELALIAVIDTPDGEKQIGVARYITLDDEETCEFAIVVGDEWQGKGLARQLFGTLIDAARQTSLKVMTGITLRDNSRMLDLARACGFKLHTDADDPSLMAMTLQLHPAVVSDEHR